LVQELLKYLYIYTGKERKEKAQFYLKQVGIDSETIIMISRDIKVVRSFCQTAAVMKDGGFCEITPTEQLLTGNSPQYTQTLIRNEFISSNTLFYGGAQWS
jgi:ABC-type methionine transport system ATPase subunit